MKSRFWVLLGCVLAVFHGTARADVTIAEFPATGQFTFNVQYMTDLDQQRAGLPGNGAMYCAPTAAMNLFSYAANFGFPEVLPGPGLWEGTEGHDTMTNAIGFMGIFMGTSSEKGTGGSGYKAGMQSWIQASGVPFSTVKVSPTGTAWPTVDTAAFFAAAGAVVNVSYGRYEWVPGPAGSPFLTKRKGGHVVTLSRAIADNGSYLGPREVRIRNPSSSDGDLNSNSQFVSQNLATAANIDVIYDLGNDGTIDPFVVTSLINPPPTQDCRYRVLDSVTALYPPGGMSYTHVEVQAVFAGGLGFYAATPPKPIQVQLGSTIESLAVHPEQHSALAIVADARGKKRLMQFPSGGTRPLPLLELPASSRHLLVGNDADVFVITATDVLRFGAETWNVRRVSETALPASLAGAPVDVAAFDPRTGAILLISNGNLVVLSSGGTGFQQALHIGSEVAQSLVVLPGAARRFVLGTAAGTLIEGSYPAFDCTHDCKITALERRRADGVTDLASLDADDSGRLYVSDRRAGLIELERNADGSLRRATRAWHSSADTERKRFAVLRSHSNVPPESHDTPEWDNIDPSELLPLGPDVSED